MARLEVSEKVKKRRQKGSKILRDERMKNFIREKFDMTESFDPRSFRSIKHRDGGQIIVLACPEGSWLARSNKCEDKMEMHSILHPYPALVPESVHSQFIYHLLDKYNRRSVPDSGEVATTFWSDYIDLVHQYKNKNKRKYNPTELLIPKEVSKIYKNLNGVAPSASYSVEIPLDAFENLWVLGRALFLCYSPLSPHRDSGKNKFVPFFPNKVNICKSCGFHKPIGAINRSKLPLLGVTPPRGPSSYQALVIMGPFGEMRSIRSSVPSDVVGQYHDFHGQPPEKVSSADIPVEIFEKVASMGIAKAICYDPVPPSTRAGYEYLHYFGDKGLATDSNHDQCPECNMLYWKGQVNSPLPLIGQTVKHRIGNKEHKAFVIAGPETIINYRGIVG